jgi:tRNA-splicing ligase RtcB
MSRSEAARRVSRAELQRQMKGVWFDWRMADAIRDEAPSAYKDIRGVLKGQHELVKVRRALRPLLNYKGT